jgi:phage gpG-like protein
LPKVLTMSGQDELLAQLKIVASVLVDLRDRLESLEALAQSIDHRSELIANALGIVERVEDAQHHGQEPEYRPGSQA